MSLALVAAVSPPQFGRHVARRTEFLGKIRGLTGQPKIGDYRAHAAVRAAAHHDVAALEIAMDDIAAMRFRNGCGQLSRDGKGVLRREPAVLGKVG